MISPAPISISSNALLAINERCERFEDALRSGKPLRIEDILHAGEADGHTALLFEYLLRIEVDVRLGLGEKVSAEDYGGRFPAYSPVIERVLSSMRSSNAPTQIGPYRIVGQLGAGGMGQVYKAVQPQLHRFVAIKVLPSNLLQDAAARRRFERELRAAGKVSHPNLVSAFDAGEQGESLYLVMELVEGLSLADVARRKPSLEIADACEVIRQAAQGIAEVHRHGLVHRDIKPGNLMLGWNERVKVLDLGLALLFERTGDEESVDLTAAGQMMGTLDYMAPEQCIDSHQVDRRADIYGLGATLFRLLTGRVPHADHERATAVGRLSAKLSAPIPPLRQLLPAAPAALEKFLARMLARSPEARPASAEEVIQELGPFCGGANLARLFAQVTASPTENGRAAPELPGDTDLLGVPPTVVHPRIKPAAVPPAPRLWNGLPRRRLLLGVAGAILIAATLGIVWQFIGKSPPITRTSSVGLEEHAASRQDRPIPQPTPAVAPFSAEDAKRRQKEWADYLQAPVEWENSVGMKFQLIPPGEFMMGTSAADLAAYKLMELPERHDRLDSESPQHRVVLTQPIYIGTQEVSQRAYQAVTGTNPSQFSGERNPSLAAINTANVPVDTVSWGEAIDFCVALSKQEKLVPCYERQDGRVTVTNGTGYRLLTEAEWEYACRAGTTTKFWSGDSDEELLKAAWMGTNSEGRTHAGGEKKPNPFGLFDTHGNVWEWVFDCYSATYYADFQDSAAVDPSGSLADLPDRVIRGGAWTGDTSVGRSAFRSYHHPSAQFNDIGFRVATSIEAARQALKTAPRK